MHNKDIVEMYIKGYSIGFIADTLYKFRTRGDVRNHKFMGNYIVTEKSCTKVDCIKDVSIIIMEYNRRLHNA